MATAERPLRLLSLDGGGVRGLSELVILKRIMFNLGHKLGRTSSDLPKPCEFFDLIGGTSTGGLIAIMLGSLEMDIDTCIGHYLDMAPKIFPEEGFVAGSKFGKFIKGAAGTTRFDPKPLESVIQQLVSQKFPQMGPHAKFDAIDAKESEVSCKVFVCATNDDTSTGFRLRDYTSTWEPSTGCKIWEAARATSAAPLFFPSIRFGTPPQNWVDGGLRANNPVRQVYDEANLVWPGRKIECIVSIGAGDAPPQTVGVRGDEILQTLVRISLDTKQTASEFRNSIAHLPVESRLRLFRFNASNIHSIGIEEWKHADKLTGLTNDYLNENREIVDECATILKSDNSHLKSSSTFHMTTLPVSVSVFFGRHDLLSQMSTILDVKKKGQKRLVLYAPSGFGKTQTALQFIENHSGAHNFVLWIDASSTDSALESFAEATIAIDRLGISNKPPSVPGLSSGRANVPFVTKWLETTSCTWLMVIDSLEDLNDINARTFLPRCHFGRIIITTTRYDLASSWGTETIEIAPFDQETGCELLISKLDPKSRAHVDHSKAKSVVEDLAGVPLAIEQASALLAGGFTIDEFQKHYHAQYRTLMSQKPAKNAWVYDKDQSIVNAFETLYSTLTGDNKTTTNFLSILCFFGAGVIPLSLFSDLRPFQYTSAKESGIHTSDSILDKLEWLTAFCGNGIDPKLAASRLQDFCLAKVRKNLKGSAESISIHDSIRRWCQKRNDQEDARMWSFVAGYVLACHSAKLGEQVVGIRLDGALRAHFSFCFSKIKENWSSPPTGPLTSAFASVMATFGRHFSHTGNYAFAKQSLTLAVESRILELGNMWPHDETSCELLFASADSKWQLGEWEDARTAFQDLLNVEPVASGQFDDIAVRTATRLRLVNDRLEGSRRAAANISEQDTQKISKFGDGYQDAPPDYPPLMDHPPQAGSENLADQEYSLTEVVTQMVDEFGNRDNDTLEARINLFYFYARHSRYLEAESAILPSVDDFITDLKDLKTYLDSLRYASHKGNLLKAVFSCLLLSAEKLSRTSEQLSDRLKYILLFAVVSNDTQLAERAIEVGACFDFMPDSNGESSLSFATRRRNPSLVRLMLQRATKADIHTEAGWALMEATRFPDHEIFEMLVNAGGDLGFKDEDGKTLMHCAAQNGDITMADYLRSLGQDVGVTKNDGATPMHSAARNGQIKMVDHLRSLGQDVAVTMNDGATTMHLAALKGHIKMVEHLRSLGQDINVKMRERATPMHLAAINGHIEMVELLRSLGQDIDVKMDDGSTTMHLAAREGHIAMVDHLRSLGQDIDVKTRDGATPIQLAARSGHIEMVNHLRSLG